MRAIEWCPDQATVQSALRAAGRSEAAHAVSPSCVRQHVVVAISPIIRSELNCDGLSPGLRDTQRDSFHNPTRFEGERRYW